jgi:hypothetical protein
LEAKSIKSREKKKNLEDSSWFGEPKCKLGSKVVHFYLLFIIYYLVVQIL